MAPPKSIYLGSTCAIFKNEVRSVHSHAPRHTSNAVNCTNALAVQMPVDFVTWVLNTPWMLISAPETKAIKKPIIGFYHLFFLVVVYPVTGSFIHILL